MARPAGMVKLPSELLLHITSHLRAEDSPQLVSVHLLLALARTIKQFVNVWPFASLLLTCLDLIGRWKILGSQKSESHAFLR